MRWLAFLTACLLLQNAIVPMAIGSGAERASPGHCSDQSLHGQDSTAVCTMDCQCPMGGGSSMVSTIEAFSVRVTELHARLDPPTSTGINGNQAPFRPPRLG